MRRLYLYWQRAGLGTVLGEAGGGNATLQNHQRTQDSPVHGQPKPLPKKDDSDGTIYYVSRLADNYKVSGDSFYTQDGKNVLPLGTLTVTETKAPNGYLLDGAYMQADRSSEQIQNLITSSGR